MIRPPVKIIYPLLILLAALLLVSCGRGERRGAAPENAPALQPQEVQIAITPEPTLIEPLTAAGQAPSEKEQASNNSLEQELLRQLDALDAANQAGDPLDGLP